MTAGQKGTKQERTEDADRLNQTQGQARKHPDGRAARLRLPSEAELEAEIKREVKLYGSSAGQSSARGKLEAGVSSGRKPQGIEVAADATGGVTPGRAIARKSKGEMNHHVNAIAD